MAIRDLAGSSLVPPHRGSYCADGLFVCSVECFAAGRHVRRNRAFSLVQSPVVTEEEEAVERVKETLEAIADKLEAGDSDEEDDDWP